MLYFGEVTYKPVPANMQEIYDETVDFLENDADLNSLTTSVNSYTVLADSLIASQDYVSFYFENSAVLLDSKITATLQNEDSLPLLIVITAIEEGGFYANIYNLGGDDTVSDTIVHYTVSN